MQGTVNHKNTIGQVKIPTSTFVCFSRDGRHSKPCMSFEHAKLLKVSNHQQVSKCDIFV